MRSFNLSCVTISMLLLQACAADYQPAQTIGGIPVSGYTDALVDSHTAIVNFDGNRFTSPLTLNNYLLMRSAQVTIDNGYDYFIITSSNTVCINQRIKTKQENHYSTIPPKVYPVVYRTVDYQSSQTSLPNTCLDAKSSRGNVSAVIKMFKGNIPGGVHNAYDAQSIIGRLGAGTF